MLTRKRLVDVPPVVIGFVEKMLPNHLIYRESDGVMLPYKVVGSEYSKADQYSPASASIKLKYVVHGSESSNSIHLNMEDLKGGKTVEQIFNENNYYLETEELNDEWKKSLEKYAFLLTQLGSVYVGRNKCRRAQEHRYYSANKYYFKSDYSNKVVIDFEGYYSETNNKFESNRIYSFSQIISKNVELPIHPYGHVFHLEEHFWLDIHVDNLLPYKFKGEELLEKLVLPRRDKDLIGMLIEMSKMEISDIVEGKTGGSFIMATGIPGTGKTLTAEVFSETVEKPLYKVQCSQLGISVDTVEKKLSEVLRRASRWGAILLIDEADVYVRARGGDINQNAIVGTFLRTLEYYTGILFMTSNMETTIDDAIMSRATAHLVYNAPSSEDQLKIWKILGKQFNADISDETYLELSRRFTNLVGRDIKALLKLALMYSKNKNIKLSVEIFENIYRFIPNVLKNNKGVSGGGN